ncbi:hypothetical protein HMPREF9019_0634 [Hoylesella timonensis CRIS 5C-B1]|uniref:Uncharacterized protein n=1 Tax=Hoylesella timonensis CRIS 5C-B1 TaxID=679189 RepID=D1VX69_9BACT|nr:hypothetical protein HMPREF9019_0634 [Hoylesella timonensis CRIS 5C-B1]
MQIAGVSQCFSHKEMIKNRMKGNDLCVMCSIAMNYKSLS